MDKLYNYIFHYNPFTKLWAGIPRGKENFYFNNEQKKAIAQGIYFSDDITTIIKVISDPNIMEEKDQA